MKSYKEYYKFGLEDHLKWLSYQKTEWWKDKKSFEYLSPKGDYIETVNILSVDEKNDSSLFHNHTNVKNSEWGILFTMLGQALVDWCRENVEWKDLWSFGIEINRVVIDLSNVYDCEFSVKRYDLEKHQWYKETDENVLKQFDGCRDFLLSIVDEFLTIHGKDVPNDWNYFSFGLDSLMDSCKWGEWVCSSDGYINLGNYNEDTKEYENFVECM